MGNISDIDDAYWAADFLVAEWLNGDDGRELADVLRERFVITFRESSAEMDRYITERLKEERGHGL